MDCAALVAGNSSSGVVETPTFKASLIFAFAPALLVLLIVDFVRTRAKNLKNEIIMGLSLIHI